MIIKKLGVELKSEIENKSSFHGWWNKMFRELKKYKNFYKHIYWKHNKKIIIWNCSEIFWKINQKRIIKI
jgi:hypothetical protein